MFLTVALMLKHLGYTAESEKISNAVTKTLQDKLVATYDLGGNSSTQQMAQAIFCNLKSTTSSRKLISILSTGSEIINGDIIDTNSNICAKKINTLGGNIFQIMQSSDNKQEIKSAIVYLLENSDCILITGGLGPTSDDNTRFALSEVIRSDLIFNDEAWKHIQARLNKFNLSITKNNKQQALFPKHASLIRNHNGTAYGCYIQYFDKHILLIPGPPKECLPMIEEYILPKLAELKFFNKYFSYTWKTLGVIEGEISHTIDNLIERYNLYDKINISYRWNYPYVDIKLSINSMDDNCHDHGLDLFIKEIDILVEDFLISNDQSDAFTVLNKKISWCSDLTFVVIDNVTCGEFQNVVDHRLVSFDKTLDSGYSFSINYNEYFNSNITSLERNNNSNAFVKIMVSGAIKENHIYTHEVEIPNRGSEINLFINAYLAWQLSKFIEQVQMNVKNE